MSFASFLKERPSLFDNPGITAVFASVGVYSSVYHGVYSRCTQGGYLPRVYGRAYTGWERVPCIYTMVLRG